MNQKIVTTSGVEKFLNDEERSYQVIDDTAVLTSEQIKWLTTQLHETTPPTPEQQAKLDAEAECLEKQAQREIQRELQRGFDPGAVQVAPYKPNRKQRRAQQAVERKVAKNYPLHRKECRRDE